MAKLNDILNAARERWGFLIFFTGSVLSVGFGAGKYYDYWDHGRLVSSLDQRTADNARLQAHADALQLRLTDVAGKCAPDKPDGTPLDLPRPDQGDGGRTQVAPCDSVRRALSAANAMVDEGIRVRTIAARITELERRLANLEEEEQAVRRSYEDMAEASADSKPECDFMRARNARVDLQVQSCTEFLADSARTVALTSELQAIDQRMRFLRNEVSRLHSAL